ncbi:17921_t:CDS:2, partial [Racocetra fulgida]
LSYFANEMTENEILEILNQTNINTFEERLEKEGFDKNKLLLFNNLDFNEPYTLTKENLFSDNKDNDEDLLLEANEILENINEQTSQISEQDDYNWDPEDYLNSDDD